MKKAYLIGVDKRIDFLRFFLSSEHIEHAYCDSLNCNVLDRPGVVVFFPEGFDNSLIKQNAKNFMGMRRDRDIKIYLVCSEKSWNAMDSFTRELFDGAIHAYDMQTLLQTVISVVRKA
jgi:hypothetical protein